MSALKLMECYIAGVPAEPRRKSLGYRRGEELVLAAGYVHHRRLKLVILVLIPILGHPAADAQGLE